MKAEFDLAIGGISASVINPTGFLDIYSDDNRSGFLMNWGFDTSTANIEVKYLAHNYNQYGDVIKTNYHYEIWSYNAIASVLNGEIFIQDGKEANKAKPVFQQILPTEFTFKVEEFHNTAYTNITYSIYQYLSDGSGYQIFNDLKDETVSQEVITINGTKPYPYNYEIVINYDLVYGDNERQYSTHIWSPSSDLIEAIITSDQSAKIRLYTDDFNRYFVADSVVVYLASDSSQVTDAQVIYDGSSIEITGLSPDTDYYIDFQTSDGFTDEWIIDLGLSIDFSTDPTPIQ
jgi:hypothetical protein